jgi:hypothetical protein
MGRVAEAKIKWWHGQTWLSTHAHTVLATMASALQVRKRCEVWGEKTIEQDVYSLSRQRITLRPLWRTVNGLK